MLLIRLDAIGDYILFRNFIEIIKNSEKYKDYKITLVGNSVWKDIAENLDSQYIDNFFWLDKSRFNKNLFYRYKKLKEITANAYDVVLSPVYSRDFFYTDTIVKIVHANEKLGSIGDLSNIKPWQKKISDKYYTRLIQSSNCIMFEFYRNKEFFQNLLDCNLAIEKPFIDIKKINSAIILPKNYVVLFLGASTKFRKWSVENFIAVASFIKAKYNLDIVICGDATDEDAGKEFDDFFHGEVLNLVGKTSLLDVLVIINNARLLIANESSAPHIAVALEIPDILVISNGNHFGRFTPYPKGMSDSYNVIYPPDIENNLDDYKKISNQYGNGSLLNINNIDAKNVIKKIDR